MLVLLVVPSVLGVWAYFIFYVHVFIASTVDFFSVCVLYPMNLLNSLCVVFFFCFVGSLQFST